MLPGPGERGAPCVVGSPTRAAGGIDRFSEFKLPRASGLLPGLRIARVAGRRRLRLGRCVRGSRVTATPRAGGAATVDHHHRSLNGNACRTNINKVTTHLDRRLDAPLGDSLHSRLEMDFLAGVNGMFVAYLLLLVTGDGERLASTDILFAVSRNRQARVFLNRFLFFPLMTMS